MVEYGTQHLIIYETAEAPTQRLPPQNIQPVFALATTTFLASALVHLAARHRLLHDHRLEILALCLLLLNLPYDWAEILVVLG